MSARSSRITIMGTLLLVALFVTAVSIIPADEFQTVDAQSKNQPMVCNGSDKIITFPNFVTAHIWLEQVRWKKVGSYSVGMEFDAGKNVALSYRCTKA